MEFWSEERHRNERHVPPRNPCLSPYKVQNLPPKCPIATAKILSPEKVGPIVSFFFIPPVQYGNVCIFLPQKTRPFTDSEGKFAFGLHKKHNLYLSTWHGHFLLFSCFLTDRLRVLCVWYHYLVPLTHNKHPTKDEKMH